jgi:hypothetical protein
MRPIFIQLTNLSGVCFWLSVQHIISITRVGKATYVRCVDDYPDPDASNVVRCVVETPDEIFTLMGALVHTKPDLTNPDFPNNN